MIAKALTQIHSSDNLTEEGKRGREVTRSAYPGVIERREENNNTMDDPFTIEEMKRAIMRSGLTSPGKDEICYVMLKHLGVLASMKLLGFYNKVWAVGKLDQNGEQVELH